VYQKGGWVLHMLRGVMGTDRFWTGIRDYYTRYRDRNASTDDFRQVMERAAGAPLSWFFDQWLERPGMPMLGGTWRYDAAARRIEIDLRQLQSGESFRIPLEIAIRDASGQSRVERVELTASTGQFAFAADAEPAEVTLDPNTWVLMQAVAFGKR
jgi:aminopeptidase N